MITIISSVASDSVRTLNAGIQCCINNCGTSTIFTYKPKIHSEQRKYGIDMQLRQELIQKQERYVSEQSLSKRVFPAQKL